MTEMSAARAATKARSRAQAAPRRSCARSASSRRSTTAARLAVADGLHHTVYGVGEVIMRAGDPGDSLYIMRSGSVSVRLGVDGLEKEVAVLRRRRVLRRDVAHDRRAAPRDGGGARDAECYVIDRALFQQILRQQRAVGRGDRQALERTRNEELRSSAKGSRRRRRARAPIIRRCCIASGASSGYMT